MGDYEDEKEYDARMRRRMPWQGTAGVLILLAIGVLAGAGLQALVLVGVMVLVALGLFLWSLRL